MTTPRLLRFAPLAILLVALALVLASGAWRGLSLDGLAAHRAALKSFVHRHPWESVVLYVGLYGAVVALSIPGALVMTLTGGFLFGTWIGGAAAALGVALGATVMFMAAQTVLGDVLRRWAAPGGLLQTMEAGVRRHAFTYLLFLRLMPAAPIFLVNIAAAFVRTRLWIYAAATLIGIAPSCFIYASIGAGLDRAFGAGGRVDLRALFHPEMVAALVALALLALSPLAYRAWRGRRRAALPNGPA